MPIKIPDGLPAKLQLEEENISVMTEMRASHQDIRPLKIAILNLMPTKITTETQLIRLLSNSSIQVDLTLLSTASHAPRHTAAEHMKAFYKNFFDVRNDFFDGLIITGAPVENLEFENVDYWQELCCVMEWSKTHVFSTIHICWAAQAGLYFHHGVPKYHLEKKMSGIFLHSTESVYHPILRGFDEIFYAPHSRHTEIRESDILSSSLNESVPGHRLEILAKSQRAGVYLVGEECMRRFYLTGHPEYDTGTLASEYQRDVGKGLKPEVPENYFPENNPQLLPINRWRGHAHLLFSNWVNNIVYQMTPYNAADIEKIDK